MDNFRYLMKLHFQEFQQKPEQKVRANEITNLLLFFFISRWDEFFLFIYFILNFLINKLLQWKMYAVFIKLNTVDKGEKSRERPAQKVLKIMVIMNYIMIIIDFSLKFFPNHFRNVIHNLIMCPKIIDKIMNYITKKKYFITFGLWVN
jgi:hypothetical protein